MVKAVRCFCGQYVLINTRFNSYPECVKSCIITCARPCIIYKIQVSGRYSFCSVNPEFRMIEGQIIEVLL